MEEKVLYSEDKTLYSEKHLAAAKKANVSPADYVPTKEKLAYSCGALMDGGGVALMSCVMLKYMTDTLAIAAGIASTIMMISKIWDAITDPVMGFITDNTRSKYGRRKPYMLIGGIALIVAIILLFAPIREWGISGSGVAAYILIFYMFWNTCSTISQVPYTSMASDISPAYSERNNANTFKLVFSAVSGGLAYVIPLLLLAKLQSTDPSSQMSPTVFWIVMVVIFGTLFGGGLIVTAKFAKERVKPLAHEKRKFDIKSFFKGYIDPYRNKSYKWHIVMYVCAFTCMDMLSALAAYYADHVWRGTVMNFGFMQMQFSSMFIVAPLMVAAVIAFPLVRKVMDIKGKGFAFRMGLPLYIIGGILIAVMDPAWASPWIIPVAAFLMGFGFGGAQMIPWMNFPDTLDVAELKLGERPTGNYSGMMTLIRKIGGALGVGMIGWVMTGVGYDQYNAAITGAKAYTDKFAADYSAEFTADFNSQTSQTIGSFLNDNSTAITDKVNQLVTNGKISEVGELNLAEISANVDKVLLTIRLLMGIAIALLIAIAMFGSFKFKLNNKILARMRYFTDKVKAGEYDTLTEEEKQERIDLIKKHYGKYDARFDAEMIARMKENALLCKAEEDAKNQNLDTEKA